jgi:hypothetical protein
MVGEEVDESWFAGCVDEPERDEFDEACRKAAKNKASNQGQFHIEYI